MNTKKYVNKNIFNMDKLFFGEDGKNGFLNLNKNESMYNFPSEIIDDIQTKISNIDFTKYSQNNILSLKQGLSHYYKCDSEQILIDNGIYHSLQKIFQAITNSGDTVVSVTPSCITYSQLCKLNKITLLEVDFENNWEFPQEEILDMNADVIIISNPNNPTGTYIDTDIIESILKSTKSIVIVDETYINFAGDSVVPLSKLYENLIVIRNFSKDFMFDSMQISITIANPDLITQIEKLFPQSNLDTIKQQSIISLLKYQSDFFSFYQKIKLTKDFFQSELQSLGFKTTTSFANFVFVYGHKNISLKNLFKYLKSQKILVMYFPNTVYDSDYIRISIGTDEQMKKVLETIKDYKE